MVKDILIHHHKRTFNSFPGFKGNIKAVAVCIEYLIHAELLSFGEVVFVNEKNNFMFHYKEIKFFLTNAGKCFILLKRFNK